jgi:hypothetical protein
VPETSPLALPVELPLVGDYRDLRNVHRVLIALHKMFVFDVEER